MSTSGLRRRTHFPLQAGSTATEGGHSVLPSPSPAARPAAVPFTPSTPPPTPTAPLEGTFITMHLITSTTLLLTCFFAMNEGFASLSVRPFFQVAVEKTYSASTVKVIAIPPSTLTVISLSVSVSVSTSTITDTATCPVWPPLLNLLTTATATATPAMPPHAVPTESQRSPAVNFDAGNLGGVTLPEWPFWQVMVMVVAVAAITLGLFWGCWAMPRNIQKEEEVEKRRLAKEEAVEVTRLQQEGETEKARLGVEMKRVEVEAAAGGAVGRRKKKKKGRGRGQGGEGFAWF
ncbi:hypothetical protein BDZ91DRAFT_766600 [Kalaharituber pfeilii]|nr:hypothetical protein BDZ91DRAFT_766600 [Kalaharituber pfeilii]